MKFPSLAQTVDRNYVLERQLKLLQHALAPWPRRSASLLLVNCGDGAFLPMLWHAGFDPVATEPDVSLRAQAFELHLPDSDIRAATQDDLPFIDDAFDWVIVNLRARDSEGIAKAVQEALRVACRGIIFTFWNRTSLAAHSLFARPGSQTADLLRYATPWWKVWKQVRLSHAGRLTSLSTLCGPAFTWNRSSRLSIINEWITILALGAWGIVRLDISPFGLYTGLGLRIQTGMQTPQPAMEYAHKNMSGQSHLPDK